jgi:hypothetical protein
MVAVFAAQVLQRLHSIMRLSYQISNTERSKRTPNGHQVDFVIIDQQDGPIVGYHVVASFQVNTNVVPRVSGVLSTQI